MSFFKKDPPPDSEASRAMGASIETLTRQIDRDTTARDKIASVSGNFLGGAIGLAFIFIVTPLHIPLLGLGAVVAFAGYGITKMLKSGYDQDIAKNREAIAELEVHQDAARLIGKPAGKPPVPKQAKAAFNKPAANTNDPAVDAARIAALEERIAELKGALEGPRELDKPKTITSRLGFGG
ncbi:MAG TPA: hypothetical protein VEF76_05220 [Patescibacteria group bacterium]|nr:hypothetical protein [Patescibacteria group bacterium]